MTGEPGWINNPVFIDPFEELYDLRKGDIVKCPHHVEGGTNPCGEVGLDFHRVGLITEIRLVDMISHYVWCVVIFCDDGKERNFNPDDVILLFRNV